MYGSTGRIDAYARHSFNRHRKTKMNRQTLVAFMRTYLTLHFGREEVEDSKQDGVTAELKGLERAMLLELLHASVDDTVPRNVALQDNVIDNALSSIMGEVLDSDMREDLRTLYRLLLNAPMEGRAELHPATMVYRVLGALTTQPKTMKVGVEIDAAPMAQWAKEFCALHGLGDAVWGGNDRVLLSDTPDCEVCKMVDVGYCVYAFSCPINEGTVELIEPEDNG